MSPAENSLSVFKIASVFYFCFDRDGFDFFSFHMSPLNVTLCRQQHVCELRVSGHGVDTQWITL